MTPFEYISKLLAGENPDQSQAPQPFNMGGQQPPQQAGQQQAQAQPQQAQQQGQQQAQPQQQQQQNRGQQYDDPTWNALVQYIRYLFGVVR